MFSGLKILCISYSLLVFLTPLSQGDGVLHEDFQPCASRALWPGSASSIKCQVSATRLFPEGDRVGQGQNMGLGPAQRSLGWISDSVLLGREPLAGGTPGWHLELALWLLPQSFPVSCHPRPSGTTTALLLRHTGSASTDPTPGRRDWVWTSAQEEGDGKEASNLMSPLLLLVKWGLGKQPTLPLSLQKKRKRRVFRLPRSGVLDRELPLPRLRGEHHSLLGSYWISLREGKVLKS